MTSLSVAARGALVEVVLLSADRGRLRFRVVRANRGAEAPDAVARGLAGVPALDPAGLLHSTSWRFEANRIVLTYVALPDPTPAAGGRPVPLVAPTISAGPLAPSPEEVTADEVAAHACRHLSYLRQTDPLVAARAAAAPRLWELIDEFVPAVAGLLRQPAAPDGRLVSVVE